MSPEDVTAETIAAARLRLVLDEKLGRVTPDRVREIAALSGPLARQQPGMIVRTSPRVLSVAGFEAALPAAAGQRSLLRIAVDARVGGITGAASCGWCGRS